MATLGDFTPVLQLAPFDSLPEGVRESAVKVSLFPMSVLSICVLFDLALLRVSLKPR